MTLNNINSALRFHNITPEQYKFDINNMVKDNITTKPEVVNSLYSYPFGYPAIKTIKNTTGFPRKDVVNTLHSNDIYTTFKKPRPVSDFRTITSEYVDEIWSADLVEMKSPDDKDMYKRNHNMRYVLIIIDLFSRYVWAFPLESKAKYNEYNFTQTVLPCFRELFNGNAGTWISMERVDDTPVKPKKLWVDRGGEFYNNNFINFLKLHNIQIYSTKSIVRKPAIVERFNRTFKEYMWKYFAEKNTLVWYNP